MVRLCYLPRVAVVDLPSFPSGLCYPFLDDRGESFQWTVLSKFLWVKSSSKSLFRTLDISLKMSLTRMLKIPPSPQAYQSTNQKICQKQRHRFDIQYVDEWPETKQDQKNKQTRDSISGNPFYSKINGLQDQWYN